MVLYRAKRLQNKFDTAENLYEGEANVPDMKDWIKES